MEKNYFFTSLLLLKFQIILFVRRLRYLFTKKSNFLNTDFLNIIKDENFSNSLIEIDFHFSKLLYLKLPQIGRKYYNGKVVLNAKKLQFPYKIEVYVYGQKKKTFSIESFEAINNFRSEKFRIIDFKSFNNLFNYPKLLNLPRHKMVNGNPIIKIEPIIFDKKNTLRNSIKKNKIKLQPFNTDDLI